MMDWLAWLVDRRPWRVVILAAAIFAAAGVLGAGVGDRLDPYGADDPGTESVIADKRLEKAGFRKTGVVVRERDSLASLPAVGAAVSRCGGSETASRLFSVAEKDSVPGRSMLDSPGSAEPARAGG